MAREKDCDIRSTIFAPVAWWERHLAYSIEIAHREAELGREVFFIQCRQALATCAANPEHLKWKCEQCVHQSTFSIRNHFPTDTKVLLLQPNQLRFYEQECDTSQIRNMDDLREYRYKHFPFGRHVLSHLVSIYRDRVIPDHVIQSLGIQFLNNSIAAYEEIMNLMPTGSDFVFVWGGRRSSEAPMKFAAQSWNSKLFFFEEGSSLDKIYITENDPITFEQSFVDIISWEKMRKSNSQEQIMIKSGKQYFLERKLGTSKEPNFRWFLANSAPAQIRKTSERPILSIFTSSDWEFAEYDSLKNNRVKGEFSNKYEVLNRILNDNEILSKFTLIVRWHPNHKIAGRNERATIEELISSNPQVDHYKFDNPIDSYDLVQKSDVVVVFGSTIGIEAAAAGIPTILLGDANYSRLGVVYEPDTYTSFKMLLKGRLDAMPNYWAFVWADWLNNRGIKFGFVKMRENAFFISDRRILRIKYSIKLRYRLSKLLVLFKLKA